MADRSTHAEFLARVQEVFRLRLGGAEFEDLRQYASAPERAWNVSERQLWRYVAAADRMCRDHFRPKARHLLARHCLQRRQLYAHAMSAGDFRTALAVLDSEAKLEGLDPLTKLKIREAEEFAERLEAVERVLGQRLRGGKPRRGRKASGEGR